jgi:hypothetical protein
MNVQTEVVAERPEGWPHNADGLITSKQASLRLGLTEGGLNTLTRRKNGKLNPFIRDKGITYYIAADVDGWDRKYGQAARQRSAITKAAWDKRYDMIEREKKETRNLRLFVWTANILIVGTALLLVWDRFIR